MPCTDPTDHGPVGRVTAGATYWIRGLSESEILQHFDSFEQWLSEHDFAILVDERPKFYFLSGENRKDGFLLAFRYYPGVTPSISAGSPCVWPNGTPEPKAR